MTETSQTGAQHNEQQNAQHIGILWMLRFDHPLPAGPAPRIPVTIQRAGPEIAAELAALMGYNDPAPILQRFMQGKQCYIVRVEGKIVAYGWITFDQESIGELGMSIRLLPREAYIWDCATLPTYRGLRLYPVVLAHMLAELRQAGLQRIWIGTDADNLPSQVGVALVGFAPVMDVMMTGTTGQLWPRGYPDMPAQDVADAQQAIFGSRD